MCVTVCVCVSLCVCVFFQLEQESVTTEAEVLKMENQQSKLKSKKDAKRANRLIH